MTEPDFTTYAIKESKEAFASRQTLPRSLQTIISSVMWELAEKPGSYPDRTLPAERGTSRYVHPKPQFEITFKVDEPANVIYFLHVSAQALPARHTVFISYSHADSRWVEELMKFLIVLEREGVIKLWSDRNIDAGDRWEDSIREALDSARAAVLLVSQDFLISEFITTYELPRLLEAAQRGTRIFWIPVSPSTVFDSHVEITAFQSPIADPQHVSLQDLKPAERKKALAGLYKKVREALAV